MTTSGKGTRSRTRSKLRAEKRAKFKVEPFLQEFAAGQRVAIIVNPAYHGGMPHTRFQGRVAVVKAKRGASYEVSLKMGNKEKLVITGPEHLKAIKQ